MEENTYKGGTDMKTTQKVVLILLVGVLFALLLAQIAFADTYFHPTIPGTTARDYNKPSLRMDNRGNIHRTIPGTTARDYNAGGYRIDGNRLRPTLEGTNIIDYNQPGYNIDYD